jgi:integrase
MSLAPQSASPHRRRYQRGSLIRRGPRWIGRWMEDELCGPFLTLKRVYRSEALGDVETMTKQEAQRALSLKIAAVTPLDRGTLFSELWLSWSATYQKKYKLSTWTMITSMTRYHLIPNFGAIPVQKIGAAEINAFVQKLMDQRYDPLTIRNIVLCLKVMLESAAREVKGVVLPMEGIRNERRALLPEEMKRVLSQVCHPTIRVIVRIAAETGLRIGEILALKWENLGLGAAKEIRVQGTLYKGEIQTPKTKKGKRRVAISSGLADAIDVLWDASCTGDQFVFSPFHFTYAVVLKSVKRALLECGFDEPGLGMHSFRHGNATLLDSIGAPLRIRMDRLGHSRSDTTLGVYTGTSREDESRVAEEIGRALA